MQSKKFGQTDLVVSELGLGRQSLGGGLYYRNDRESIQVLHRAMDSGVTFFDVSDHHSLGVSERLLGRAFKGNRSRVIITTKAGFDYTPLPRASTLSELEENLGSLRVPPFTAEELAGIKTATGRGDG